ncbi:hypothetical protein ATCVNEJV3_669R [Acanthocystis turfacea Chlorella virus NE-JV-3]|nr:hypothetical protein ATCVNEJV3_669R [Acanthocystis turfacea Chlorella virus NE-JV-3]
MTLSHSHPIINSNINVNSNIHDHPPPHPPPHSHSHTLVADGEQAVAVRAFVYDTLGKKGTFALYFTDLKFSQPVRLAHGCGNFIHNGTKVHFEVCTEHITMRCTDSKVLENVVVAALDKHFERER